MDQHLRHFSKFPIAFRERIVSLLDQLKESISLIGDLKTAIEKKHAAYDDFIGKVQQAATPKQIALFHRYLNNHANELREYIPNFSRNIHHIPNAEFITDENIIVPLPQVSTSSTGSSSNS